MSIILSNDNSLEKTQMREAYSKTIMEIIEEGKPVIHMDADLMRAIGLLPYREKYPEHILECGIAEANMMGVAAGLSLEGFIPFAHTFAVFASRRACDQIFMSGAYARLNVKVVGSDPGVTAGLNGGTHQAFEDIAIMRAIPKMTIVEPSDTAMVKKTIRIALDTYGMFYLRMFRMNAVQIYEKDSEFTIGKAVKLREGSDVTIFACGVEVIEAVRAADSLKKEGISARVYDMFTIKPVDQQAILEAAAETGAIVTAENHNIIGGLGSAVAEVLIENHPVPMERIGISDTFGEVGQTDWLKEKFELTSRDIMKKVYKVIERKTIK